MYTTTSKKVSPINAEDLDTLMRLNIRGQLLVASTSHPGETGRVVGVQIMDGLDGQEYAVISVEFLPNE